MIEYLKINNLFLFDQIEIFFGKGFHVFTGETGGGKTAILKSISLLCGLKADTDYIRKEKELGSIEGRFSIHTNKNAKELLLQEGYALSLNEPLMIRREIHRSGKTRIFINDELSNLSFLKTLGPTLIELITQNSHQNLITPSYHQKILDIYANLETNVEEFGSLWRKNRSLQNTLKTLFEKKRLQKLELDLYQEQLSEIDKVDLQKGEEEELSSEHNRLIHSHELLQTIEAISHDLEELSLPLLKKHQKGMEKMGKFDPLLQDSSSLFHNACLELEEVANHLQRYAAKIDMDPERLFFVEERLSAIFKLKKKFGPTFEEIESQKKTIQSEIDQLINLDLKIEELQNELQDLEKKCDKLASFLREKRKAHSIDFIKKIGHELQTLNMPNASFDLEISPKERSDTGDDSVSFLFSANAGENLSCLKDFASGGELSRLLLVIKTLLSQKEGCPTIIFDEIDANVGGTTAAKIGEKLKTLSSTRQIFCITHFLQVARCAEHHYCIRKQESKSHTFSAITKLNEEEKEIERARMIGLVREKIAVNQNTDNGSKDHG